MTTTNVTLTEAMTARTAVLCQALNLVSQIETAQETILAMQMKLSKMDTSTSFYKVSANVCLSEIEKQTEIRNEATNTYNRIIYQLFKADMPIFGTVASDMIDFSHSLHSHSAHA